MAEDDGAVAKDTVVQVLRAHKIDVSDVDGSPMPTVKVAKGGDPEHTLKAYPLPDMLNRRMLQHLARTYGVPIHHFYHPEMALAEARKGAKTTGTSEPPFRILPRAVNHGDE